MKFNAQTENWEVSIEQIKTVSYQLIDAIRYVRKTANLPLDKYEHEGMLEDAQLAEIRIIEVAKTLGINLGFTNSDRLNYGELDVREKSDI